MLHKGSTDTASPIPIRDRAVTLPVLERRSRSTLHNGSTDSASQLPTRGPAVTAAGPRPPLPVILVQEVVKTYASGAVQVQFVTKRGTNELHGQIFDQFRNDALNANSWLNSVSGLKKNVLRLNIGSPPVS